MKKTVMLVAAIMILLFSVSAQPQNTENQVKAGITPGDLFYWVENTVEKAEVKMAEMIGGPDLKAKAIANNAEERLSEARALDEQNKTEKASELRRKYSEQINKSKDIAKNSKDQKLKDKLENITRKNQEVLKEIKNRTPEKAQRGIEKALNNSKKSPEKSGADREGSVKGKTKSEEVKRPQDSNQTPKTSSKALENPGEVKKKLNSSMKEEKANLEDNITEKANKSRNSSRETPRQKNISGSSEAVSTEESGQDIETSNSEVENSVEEAGSGTGLP